MVLGVHCIASSWECKLSGLPWVSCQLIAQPTLQGCCEAQGSRRGENRLEEGRIIVSEQTHTK